MATDLLNIGKSSLFTAKQSMSTTSHNIANANNEAFSRQEVRAQTGPGIARGNYILGSGVEVKDIRRNHDDLIEKRLNLTLTSHKFNEERTTHLSKVEEIFNEINTDGLNKILNRFFNSFRELSTQPENETLRNIVKENAKIVVNDFHRVRGELDEIRGDLNKKIAFSIDEINGIARTIGSLNREISFQEIADGAANDLRDQRDQAVRTLAEYFPLTTYTDNKNQFVVNIEGIGSLVSGTLVQELTTGSSVKQGENSDSKGDTQIYFLNRPGVPMTNKFKSGTLGAQIKTRDIDVINFTEKLDELAHGLVLSTNAIHRKGFANHEVPTDEQGRPLPSSQKVTGINFFKEPLDLNRASEYIEISDDIKKDANNIATALEANKPGDNRVAIAISKLQHEKVLGGGHTTFEEEYLDSVGKIGLHTAKSKIDEEQSAGILAQAKTFKERMSGVSLDEEAANMVRYQNAYEASAKVIKASEEMFQSVLNLMP